MRLLMLNPIDTLPLTDQIVNGLRKQIEQRALRAGTRLPSIRNFAKTHRVSTVTVVQAYDRLVQDGYLVSRRGSGFYVARDPKGRRSRSRTDLAPAEDTLWILRSALQHQHPVIRVGAGWLPPSWLDVKLIVQGVSGAAGKGGLHLLDYGEPQGLPSLREQLVFKLAENGIKTDTDHVITTHGVSQAIDLICRYFVRPGDVVLVDDPGYYVTFGYLKTLGATLLGVPRTPHGPDISALESLVATHRPKLFFTMSVLHNPTGTDMSQAVAHQVLQLAEKGNFVIVEDDAYGDLHPDAVTRLAALDQLQRVIYVSGFSKTVSPDLRVGFLAARHDLAQDLLDLKLLSSITTSQLVERIVVEILESGRYEQHLNRLRARLAEQRRTVMRKLEDCGLEMFSRKGAGMFLWARYDDSNDAAQIASRGAAKGIMLGPGHLFRPHQEPSPWLRFNVAYCDEPAVYRFLRQLK
jgi:DNA-binding transcriptional MocR family regulator